MLQTAVCTCAGLQVTGPCLQSYPGYNLRQPGPGTAAPRPRGAAAAGGSGGTQETVWTSGARDPAPSLTSLCNVMIYKYPQLEYLYLPNVSCHISSVNDSFVQRGASWRWRVYPLKPDHSPPWFRSLQNFLLH